MNNWAISASRIVNLNRSPNAMVSFTSLSHVSVLVGDNLDKFKAALRQYIKDNARIWDSMNYCRVDKVDTSKARVTRTSVQASYLFSPAIFLKFILAFAVSLSLRHRNSWQDAALILINRAELFRFIYATQNELGIIDGPASLHAPDIRLPKHTDVLEKVEDPNGSNQHTGSSQKLQSPMKSVDGADSIDSEERKLV
jgi:hypothetical protein